MSHSFPSQNSSVQTYPCRWEWCRHSFPDNSVLVEHVLSEHIHKARPVKRRDIPLLRRAEEGSGDGYRVLYSLYSGSPSRSAAASLPSPQRSLGQSPQDIRPRSHSGPSSSLPSPPVSSPMLDLNFQESIKAVNSPGHHPQTKDAMESQEAQSLTNVTTIDLHPLQTQARNATPTFASFGSPAGSQTSLAIPGSPAFSSLVHRPGKRALNSDHFEKSSPKRPNTGHHYQPPSQSRLNRRLSTGSQMAVEEQLTQLNNDINGSSGLACSEHDSDQDAVGAEVSEEESDNQEMDMEPPKRASQTFSLPHRHDVDRPELDPALSQAEMTQSSSRESQQEISQMDIMTQPPSQFQYPAFPFHIHGPRNSMPDTQPESDSNFFLDPPAPFLNPAFAVSTPTNRQNWYQPPLARPLSGQDVRSPLITQKHPANPVVPLIQSKYHSPSHPKSKKFRSGTLQLTPAPPKPVNQDAMTYTQVSAHGTMRRHDSPSQSQSQSYMDSSQPFQDSFLLQTQAPYQSQTLSQF